MDVRDAFRRVMSASRATPRGRRRHVHSKSSSTAGTARQSAKRES